MGLLAELMNDFQKQNELDETRPNCLEWSRSWGKAGVNTRR